MLMAWETRLNAWREQRARQAAEKEAQRVLRDAEIAEPWEVIVVLKNGTTHTRLVTGTKDPFGDRDMGISAEGMARYVAREIAVEGMWVRNVLAPPNQIREIRIRKVVP